MRFLNFITQVLYLLAKPRYRLHAFSLIYRKLLPRRDGPQHRKSALKWAKQHAVTAEQAIEGLGLYPELHGFDAAALETASVRVGELGEKMGGAAHLDFLADIIRLSKPARIVETGVALGWSSLAILHTLRQNGFGRLVSVDMAYPGRGLEAAVGLAVPAEYESSWELLDFPDRPGLKYALRRFNYEIDVCHYDSDKSYWGRAYAFPLLWDALVPGGLLISDDIQDNEYFSEFAERHRAPYFVVNWKCKYIGVIKKQKLSVKS